MANSWLGVPAMSRARISIRIFSIYLFVVAGVLILIPNILFSLLRVPETDEVWIRVVGVLSAVLAYYYLMASGSNMIEFLRWTTHARLFVFASFLVFVLAGLAPPVLIVFGIADGAAALWTASCLKGR